MSNSHRKKCPENSINDINSCRKYARPAIQHSEDEIERRALLHKEWARYKHREKKELYALYERVMKGQRIALDELRKESETLYLAAIEADQLLMPISIKGPVQTPAIDNYMSPAEYRSMHCFPNPCSTSLIDFFSICLSFLGWRLH